MKITWLITARGGSKGVPGKNLRRIGDISLIEWKYRAALAAGADKVWLSTEDAAIAAEGARLGCSVIARPEELATDTASSASVVRHALEVIGCDDGAVMLLEPSAPFTRAEDYRRALSMMDAWDADLVVGMKTVEPHPAFVGDQRDDNSVTGIILSMQRHGRNLRRQDLKPQWTMNGCLYLFKTEMFLRTGEIYGGSRNYGLLMPPWVSIEIDSMNDLEMAGYAYSRVHVSFEGENPRGTR